MNRPDTMATAAPPHAGSGQRLAALDASRGFLMLLGLVIHASDPYHASGGWLVDEPGGSGVFTQLIRWISTFRMPAFFLLAGLLSAWALERRPGWSFLTRRTGRLLLPLAAGVITVNLLQQSLLEAHAATHCTAGEPCTANPGSTTWIGHLWFLLDLFVYTAILVVAAPVLKRGTLAAQRAFAALPRWLANASLLVLPFAMLFAWSLGVGAATLAFDVLDRPFFGFWSFTAVADNLFFFLAGAVLAGLPALRDVLAKPVPLAIPLVTGVLGTLALALRYTFEPPRGTTLEEIVFELVDTVPMVLLTVFAITACMRLYGHAHGFTSLVARWSYSVYLFHHLFVVGVALWLLEVALPIPAKFLVTLAAAALLSALAAALVERSRVLTLLFNGEWQGAARDGNEGSGADALRPSGAPQAASAPGTASWVLETLETPVRTGGVAQPPDTAPPDRLAG